MYRANHPLRSDTCPARSAALFSSSRSRQPPARARSPNRPQLRSAQQSHRTARSRACR